MVAPTRSEFLQSLVRKTARHTRPTKRSANQVIDERFRIKQQVPSKIISDKEKKLREQEVQVLAFIDSCYRGRRFMDQAEFIIDCIKDLKATELELAKEKEELRLAIDMELRGTDASWMANWSRMPERPLSFARASKHFDPLAAESAADVFRFGTEGALMSAEDLKRRLKLRRRFSGLRDKYEDLRRMRDQARAEPIKDFLEEYMIEASDTHISKIINRLEAGAHGLLPMMSIANSAMNNTLPVEAVLDFTHSFYESQLADIMLPIGPKGMHSIPHLTPSFSFLEEAIPITGADWFRLAMQEEYPDQNDDLFPRSLVNIRDVHNYDQEYGTLKDFARKNGGPTYHPFGPGAWAEYRAAMAFLQIENEHRNLSWEELLDTEKYPRIICGIFPNESGSVFDKAKIDFWIHAYNRTTKQHECIPWQIKYSQRAAEDFKKDYRTPVSYIEGRNLSDLREALDHKLQSDTLFYFTEDQFHDFEFSKFKAPEHTIQRLNAATKRWHTPGPHFSRSRKRLRR